MAEQSEEVLGLDQDEATSESDDTTDSQNDDVSDDDTSDERKNTSNWKKMTEAKKQLARELQAEREEKAVLNGELQKLKEWANSLYEDETQKPFTKKEEVVVENATSKLEQKIFLLENKEAKEHLDEIHSYQESFYKKHGVMLDLDDSWEVVKAKLPPESKSKKDFDTSTKATKLPKDLTKVSAEDALTLPKEEQARWRKANGWE